MRKTLAKVLILTLAATLYISMAACAEPTDFASVVGGNFAKKMADRDYEGAYELLYSFSSDVRSESDFVERFTNIYDALKITQIELVDSKVEKKEGSEKEYTLTYTLGMKSDLLGDVAYDYTADIIQHPLGYAVIYSPSLILPSMEDGDKVRVMNRYGVRGEIFSADGKLLAQNTFAQSVYVDFDKKPDIEQIKTLLSKEYGVDEARIQKKYDNAVEKGYPLEVLATFPRDTLTPEDITKITEVNGLGVDDERLTPIRYYPLADNAAHVVGYMGSPTEEEAAELKEQGIKAVSGVGKTGIEKEFEETLRGTDGKIIYIENDKGELKETLWEEPKKDGADIRLTIDTGMQNTAYTLLAANCAEGQSGAVVVMDYKSGDVKAMVSYPSFDSNLFNFPISKAVWEYYSNPDNQNPLFARATLAVYMPGSSFKPFAAVPAIEAGLLTQDSTPPITVVDNKWRPNIAGWHFPTINRVEEPKGGPWIFEVAMKSSDNIFFAYYTLELGEQKWMEYMRRLGIGEAPEFELPVKESNLLNEDTKEISLHLLAEMGYGNGELEISPIQMASMYTAFENGGDLVNPTIVDSITKTEDNIETVLWQNERTIFKENVMEPYVIDFEHTGLRRVFTDGTAYLGYMWDIPEIYGKTGTGRMGNREINWIICINPNDGLLYLVVLDTGLDVGSAPKLAIMNGLLKPDNHNNALMQNPAGSTLEGQGTGNNEDVAEGTGNEELPDTPELPDAPPEAADPNPNAEE